MCINNKHLKDKIPRGNGTLCQVPDVKLKHNAPSYKCKNYFEGKCGQSMQQMLNGLNVNM